MYGVEKSRVCRIRGGVYCAFVKDNLRSVDA
jgi:hypothetical protein